MLPAALTLCLAAAVAVAAAITGGTIDEAAPLTAAVQAPVGHPVPAGRSATDFSHVVAAGRGLQDSDNSTSTPPVEASNGKEGYGSCAQSYVAWVAGAWGGRRGWGRGHPPP
jgi:hypothetical protein